jgi:hypothetical protein
MQEQVADREEDCRSGRQYCRLRGFGRSGEPNLQEQKRGEEQPHQKTERRAGGRGHLLRCCLNSRK